MTIAARRRTLAPWHCWHSWHFDTLALLAQDSTMLREAYVTVGGRQARYLEAGAGWPVVLLHAFPLNADMWRPLLEAVPDGWRFIAPDLRGFGPSRDSSPRPRPATMDQFAEDVGLVLDQLAIDRAVIGGLSMGGYVTLALFRKSPERFAGMILADTRSQADTEEGRAGRRQMLDLVVEGGKGGAAAVADRMLPSLLGSTTRRERPEMPAGVRKMIEATDPEAIAAAIEAMMGRPDSTPDLARIGVQTLLIVGDEDRLTPPADSEAIAQRITRSRLVVLPGAGHLSSLEAPAPFSRALADFLASNI